MTITITITIAILSLLSTVFEHPLRSRAGFPSHSVTRFASFARQDCPAVAGRVARSRFCRVGRAT
eukprot:8375538-Karenia_brevis.AAC.1